MGVASTKFLYLVSPTQTFLAQLQMNIYDLWIYLMSYQWKSFLIEYQGHNLFYYRKDAYSLISISHLQFDYLFIVLIFLLSQITILWTKMQCFTNVCICSLNLGFYPLNTIRNPFTNLSRFSSDTMFSILYASLPSEYNPGVSTRSKVSSWSRPNHLTVWTIVF